ncbi:MAG: GGDEF domain-containing protein [Hyphomicrobiales bacterium]|nr:MAG: GGDEF domain-containing protein [Hyphomicrobiales bacterium]
MTNPDFKRTFAYGESALGNLKRNEIPAYPRNYELWYTYSAGFNHSLNRAVNDILRSRGIVTIEEAEFIYNEHLSPNRLGNRIDEVGTRISDELHSIVNVVESFIGSTSHYGESLEDASRTLTNTQDHEKIRGIVSNLIDETKVVEEQNRTLSTELQDSRRQVTELQESLEAIRYESLTDELTTLANRKHFDQSIERAVEEASSSGEPLTLLITDIDHFKKFNDTYGHQTGDQVLRLVALSVKQNVKGQDIACRYGGEEFAVILPRTNLRQSLTVAESIRKTVQAKELVKRSTGENLGRVTISIGAATYRIGDTPQTLIERSDSCLYAAKHAGRNLVKCETDPEMLNKDKNVA